ncbi:hypothetical protein ACN27G_27450 [Plantactinospora sp. WMMB334]|uniref:hypothetical protein n=1 Tax=Plantactinospora sp. WMMB334 TaxID=3404119 RepID=UPI003B92FB4A
MSIHPTSPAPSADGPDNPKTNIPTPRTPGSIDDRGTGAAPQPDGFDTDEQVETFLNGCQSLIAGKGADDLAEAGRLVFAGAKTFSEIVNSGTGAQWQKFREETDAALARIEARPFTDDYCRRLKSIDLHALTSDQVVASVIAFAQCPSWCDPAECCPDDLGTSPIHAGIVATIRDRVNQDDTEVEVRIERQDMNGVPEMAYVAVKPSSGVLEFSTKTAGQLADAIGRAQRAVLRDQGNPEGGAR